MNPEKSISCGSDHGLRSRVKYPLLLAMLLLSLLLHSGSSIAHSLTDKEQVEAAIEVNERVGGKLPGEAVFRDETGKIVRLGDLITGPTIILPVYYNCTNICSYQQLRMAGALQKLEQKPGIDYRVISISFDETEGPELAARSKKIYLTAMQNRFPEDGWRFLTGDRANIRLFTGAIGYGFRKQGKDFIHPVASIVVSGDATIVRYLYGVAVLPKDLALAIIEAKSGIAGASVRKVMEYCFTYDQKENTYVFNLLRVSATVVILCAGGFLAFLLLTGRKRKTTSPEKQ